MIYKITRKNSCPIYFSICTKHITGGWIFQKFAFKVILLKLNLINHATLSCITIVPNSFNKSFIVSHGINGKISFPYRIYQVSQGDFFKSSKF